MRVLNIFIDIHWVGFRRRFLALTLNVFFDVTLDIFANTISHRQWLRMITMAWSEMVTNGLFFRIVWQLTVLAVFSTDNANGFERIGIDILSADRGQICEAICEEGANQLPGPDHFTD